ncbi:glycosyltransferase [soil metagenome]
MRILHLIASADPAMGGPSHAMRSLALRMRERGHEVTFATLDRPGARWIAESPVPVVALGPGRGRYGHTPELDRFLAAHAGEFDRFVVNGIWQYHSAAAARLLKGRGYVLFPHGMLDPWFREAYPKKHLKKTLYWLARERAVVNGARRVLFTAEEERLLAQGCFPGYAAKEHVLGYGADAPESDPVSDFLAFGDTVPELAGRPYLLFLGRLHEKKGCDLLLRAFARVYGDERDFRLVMAGPDHTSHRPTLERLASELGVSGQVLWPGMLSGNAKQGALRGAEAFVLPSHQENFGVAVAEALAVGTPVLVSNRVNIWREIEEDGAGLVAPDDEEGTADLLAHWQAMRPADQEVMRKRALACFHRRFRMSGVAERFERVLLES